jgi:hypothetical protein
MAEDMLPLLWEEEQEGQGSSRGRVVQYGRFLKGQRRLAHIPHSDNGFLEGLEAHVEVFDRMDGLQMFSMRGPVSFEQQEEYVTMQLLTESPQKQIKKAAFSAASRDPVLRRFASMKEYFTRGHGEEYQCCLCIRATLRDTRTGRMAVVWEQDNVILDILSDFDNGFECNSHGGRSHEVPIGRLICPWMAYFGAIHVEDPGEGVSEQDWLYRIHPASDGFTGAGISFDFKPIDYSGQNEISIDDIDENEDILTLEQFTVALQAVMTPASRDSGLGAARS